jgi:hypothetical protein
MRTLHTASWPRCSTPSSTPRAPAASSRSWTTRAGRGGGRTAASPSGSTSTLRRGRAGRCRASPLSRSVSLLRALLCCLLLYLLRVLPSLTADNKRQYSTTSTARCTSCSAHFSGPGWSWTDWRSRPLRRRTSCLSGPSRPSTLRSFPLSWAFACARFDFSPFQSGLMEGFKEVFSTTHVVRKTRAEDASIPGCVTCTSRFAAGCCKARTALLRLIHSCKCLTCWPCYFCMCT